MWQLSLFCYFQPKEQTLSIKGKDLGHFTQSSCSMSMSSRPFPCFPFLYFAKFAFNSARSEPMSKSKARLFFSKMVFSYKSFISFGFTTCLLSQFLQSISKLKLSLYLCPQLLHFSPAFCILSSEYQITIKQ